MVDRFLRAESGNVAILFGLIALPMIVLVGGATDYSRAMSLKTKLQGVVDSAALAAASATMSSNRKDTGAAYDMVADGLKRMRIEEYVSTKRITVKYVGGAVTVSVPARMPTNFLGLVRINAIDVETTAKAAMPYDKVELVLALDMSGSMRHDDKMAKLKEASVDLVEELLAARTGRQTTRIGLVPWNNAVSVGPGLANWLPDAYRRDGAHGFDLASWTGCLAVRDSDFGDHRSPRERPIPPMNGLEYPAEWGLADQNYGCTVPAATPLTELRRDKSDVLAAIDALAPSGFTISSLGVLWAERILDPKWASSWRTARTGWDDDVRKYVILLTDGMNDIPVYEVEDGLEAYPSGYGRLLEHFDGPIADSLPGSSYKASSGGNAYRIADAHTLETCARLKARKVHIYTIQFALTNPAQIESSAAVLGPCATDDESLFVVEAPEDLGDAFRYIAENMKTSYLTQ